MNLLVRNTRAIWIEALCVASQSRLPHHEVLAERKRFKDAVILGFADPALPSDLASRA
jgi:hypothetical protein